MEGFLSKIVPPRKKTLEILWCKKEYMELTPRFREIREKVSPRNLMTSCYWCGYKFKDGEMMSLAGTNKDNKSLCSSCVSKIEASDDL